MKPRHFAILFLLLGTLGPIVASASHVGKETNGIFRRISDIQTGPVSDPTVIRRERVVPDFASLSSDADTIVFNLFGDSILTGLVDQRERYSSESYALSGRLAEDSLGSFSLAVNHEVLIGDIRESGKGRQFRIDYLSDSVHLVTEIDSTVRGVCGTGPENRIIGPAEINGAPGAGSTRSTSGSCTSVSLIIFYTNLARAAAGGTNAIQAQAQLAVMTANDAYQHSGVHIHLALLHTEEIAYNEMGTYNNHLDRLTSTNDGVMDGVHAIRDYYGADMVSLFVDAGSGGTGPRTVGLAWIMTSLNTSFDKYAFSVINWKFSSTAFVLPHELGHNMGCDHERGGNVSSGRLYSYSYGFRFNGNSGQQFRTIMAYDPGTPIGYFSNPAVTYDGKPTGVQIGQPNEADNASTINNSACTVSGWRRPPVWRLPYMLSTNVWSMTGAPVVPPCPTWSCLHPNLHSLPFVYNAQVGQYAVQDNIDPGRGYWIKFDSTWTDTVEGPWIDSLTIDVASGWNMIGCIARPIAVSDILSDSVGMITSQFFAYNGRYIVSDSIRPGMAYWVRVNSPGKLILRAPAGDSLLSVVSRQDARRSHIRVVASSDLPPSPPAAEPMSSGIPKQYELLQNYPNPFNPSTVIRYQLPDDSKVRLRIYDILGREVEELVNEIQDAGFKSVEWDATSAPSGVYFYRMNATSAEHPQMLFTQINKMILVK